MPEKRSRESRLTVGEAARAVPEDFGRALESADERVQRTLRRTPLLDNLADWRLVLLAGAVGLVVGGVARLVTSWLAAVAIFLVVFVTVMLVIAGRRTGD
jgi:Flp pilus assembly protein TadB